MSSHDPQNPLGDLPSYGDPSSVPPGGYPPVPPGGYGGYGMPPKTNGKAVTSLVLGIVSFLCIPLIAGILAIIFGLQAKKEIERSQGTQTGAGMATAGLVLGIITTIITAIVIVLMITGVIEVDWDIETS